MTLSRWFNLLIGILIATNCYAVEQLADLSEDSLPVLNETLRQLKDSVDNAPRIYTGIVAPTNIPQKTGDIYINTVLHKIYVSDGTTASTNWRILN
jgi:hypothetical protein